MKIIFICQAVDLNDPVQGTTVSWIRALHKNPLVTSIIVLSLRVGEHALPKEIEVVKIGSSNSLLTFLNFYKQILRIKKRSAAFFVYQNGYYPLLLLPFKLIFGIPVFQWLAHPHNSWLTRWNIRVGASCVFTSTSFSLPIKHHKIMVIGQGVDLNKFENKQVEKIYDLVTVGRVTRMKQIEFMLNVQEVYQLEYGRSLSLCIVGNALKKDDIEYLSFLKREIAKRKLESDINFVGSVIQNDIPELFSKAKLSLFFCKGALGRSAIESMACEVPVITSNRCVGEILGVKYENILYSNSTDPRKFAKMIHDALALHEQDYKDLCKDMRRIALLDHSVDGLFKKILLRIKQDVTR